MLTTTEPFLSAEIAYRRERITAGLAHRRERHTWLGWRLSSPRRVARRRAHRLGAAH